MSDNISKDKIEYYISKHASYHNGIRTLQSLNVKEASIVLDPNTITYDDYIIDDFILYEIPFIRGDPNDGYNTKYAWRFILTNKDKKIKFLTLGKEPKLDIVTLFPKIVEWNGRSCIKLDKSCNYHNSPIRRRIYCDYCVDCGRYCPDYERCYTCKQNY